MKNQTPGYVLEPESSEPVLKLCPQIIKELDLDAGKQIQLRFGNLETSVRIIELNPRPLPTETKIQISKRVLQELHIPAGVNLSVKRTGENKLHLGPVIGILTFPQTYERKLFGFYTNYQRMLKNGLLYVFSSQGVDTRSNTIKGYYYNPSLKAWTPADLPYPEAVIDRCYPNAYRTHEKLEKQIGTGKIFNKNTMINKLAFYNALSGDSVLKSHLPETRLCINASDIEYLLNKYGKIFIKPLTGMKGRGIITAALESDGVICRHMSKGQVSEEKLADPSQILDLLRASGHPRRRYIIQEAISMMDYKGHPFCFRIMVCKNGSGQWLVPAIFTNAATGDSFLTNHAAGASQFVPLKILFNDIDSKIETSRKDFIDSLVKIGIRTAAVLDERYGPLGELGLDVVVNKSGKPQLLEANGNPGRVPRSHMIEFPNWAYQVFQLPIEYAVYLAGYKS